MRFLVVIPFGVFVRFVFVAFVVIFFFSHAHAQAPRSTFDPFQAFKQLNDGIAAIKKSNDQLLKNTATNIGQNVANDLSSALKDFGDFMASDMKNAGDLAITIPSALDGNGQQCWDMMADASKVFQANPVPNADIAATLGVASTVERIRLLAITANNVCQNTACTQVIADANGALAAALPIKSAVPDLHALCSMIPNVARGTPTRTLTSQAPSPTPSPTPSLAPAKQP